MDAPERFLISVRLIIIGTGWRIVLIGTPSRNGSLRNVQNRGNTGRADSMGAVAQDLPVVPQSAKLKTTFRCSHTLVTFIGRSASSEDSTYHLL